MKKILVTLVAVVMVFAMAFPAFADVAVKSIEGKTSPSTSEEKVLDEQGQAITGYTVVATGLSEKSDAPTEVQQNLNNALSAVKNAAKISDLATSATDKVNAYSGLKVEDFEVSELFDLSVFTDAGVYSNMNDAGADKISVKLATNLKPQDPVVVLFYGNDGTWATLDATVAADGSITVEVDQLGVIAIATETENSGSGDSPQTGDSTGIIATIFVCAALVACVGGCLIVDKKKA